MKYRIIIISLFFFIIWFFMINNQIKNNEIKEIKNKMLEVSDEELIIKLIKNNNNILIDNENKIKTINNDINIRQKKALCLKSQLDRLINWLEYNIKYCDNKANLDKFTGLK